MQLISSKSSLPIRSEVSLASLFFMAGVALIAIVGCGPRGETKSLDEVVAGARSSFYQRAEVVKDAEVKDELAQAARLLEASIDSPLDDSSARSERIAQILQSLTTRAGYTSRPALGELQSQWLAGAEGGMTSEAGKLLAARTFSLLASELDGIGFALKEREKRS